MSQEQMPQIDTSSASERDFLSPVRPEKELNLKPPLVSDEAMARMRAQIDKEFEHADISPQKEGVLENESGKGREAVDLSKVAGYLLWYACAMRYPWLGKMVFKDQEDRTVSQ